MSNCYDGESSYLCAFNTPFGTYKFNRMPLQHMLRFGRSPANGIAVHDYTIVSGDKGEEKKEECYFYDVNQPTILQVGASHVGLGACLLHDGHPVIYAFRSLTVAEQHYSQIEKELLTIVFACEHLNQFIYAKQVTVKGDHNQLEAIVAKHYRKHHHESNVILSDYRSINQL